MAGRALRKTWMCGWSLLSSDCRELEIGIALVATSALIAFLVRVVVRPRGRQARPIRWWRS
jgi:hypothetical protein